MYELFVILGLIFLNGVFAGTEIAVLTVRRTRINELMEGGHAAATAVNALRENQERFLATVQVGITVVGATAAAFGGARLARELAPWLASIRFIGEAADDVALALVVGLVSYLSLVLGELVPKSLALMHAERYALLVARPMVWLGWLGAPVVWFLTASSNLVLRLFGDRTSFTETRLSREEVLQILEEAHGSGSLEASSGEIARRALEFDELDAADIMVPRGEMQAIPTTVTSAELTELGETGHSRVPVYEGTPDRIVGFVNVREALGRRMARGEEFRLQEVLRPVPFVPGSIPAPRLLRQLQQMRSHLAVVVDEQGTLQGLVTIEDVVEELVGEIYSEDDVPIELLDRDGPDTVLVEGTAPVHEVNRMLGPLFPEREEYSTVAGWCLYVASRIPKTGEWVSGDGLRVEIVDATPRRVRRVRLHGVPEQRMDQK